MRAFLEEYGIAVFVISVIALLVVMGQAMGTKIQTALEGVIDTFKEKNIPYIIAYNKSDIALKEETRENEIAVSALTGENIYELKELIAKYAKASVNEKVIVSDLIKAGDTVLLVIPIDKAAPKGRLILPQQMVLRDILDSGAIALCCRESELTETLDSLKNPPALVITDSQVFGKVSEKLSADIPLTSFSILMARYKGELSILLEGAKALENLKDGDKVLISEGCTHHRQCDDIGTVKIPNWLRKYTGKDIKIETCSGTEFPEDLSKYAMVIHCGGCMLNEREVRYRTKCAVDQGVPITNYGTFIAYVNGILKRSLGVFPEILEQMK